MQLKELFDFIINNEFLSFIFILFMSLIAHFIGVLIGIILTILYDFKYKK